MGIVHKLKLEVRNFIIEQKRLNPSLSCRAFTLLITDKLKVKVSKSSINAIFKENNLSMPVGRRQKLKKKKFNLPVLPVMESIKMIAVDAEPQKLFLPEQVQGQEVVKEETVEPEKTGLADARIKEAEEWAIKLLETERNRLEQEKLAREEMHRKAEAEKLVREKAEAELKEKELLRRAEEEKAKAEAEQEKLAREAELKLEHDRWARLSEEESKRKEAQKAPPVVQKEEVTAQGVPVGMAKEPVFSKGDEFSPLNILPQNRPVSGAMLLRAIDCLIGGSSQINAVICKRINRDPEPMLALTQALIFESLFEKNNNFSDLWSLVGRQYTQETLRNYSQHVQQSRIIKLDILHVIFDIFTEARGVRINFPDGEIVYLDGQLHTTWPTAYLPSYFSNTVYGLKNYLNRYFFEGAPLVLFVAPGYDIPPKEFFTLLFNFNHADKAPQVLTLYGNKLEDLESISLHQQKSYAVVFCLWPWQFTSHRKVKNLGDFKLNHIEGVNKDFYLAEIEMDLWQPSLGQSITLKGCALKANLHEKTRLAIFSNNLPAESLDKLAGLYLSHWPNPEELFQDFSRKIELSTYTENTQKFSFLDDFAKSSELAEELKTIFANYIKMLDAYLRWYFLPLGYQQKDFVFTSENFYQLPAMLVADKAKASVKMQVGADHPYRKDLEYFICRFNERQIDLEPGQLFCWEHIARI